MSIIQENLEERMARIAKRNEEIEQKHREAEEDRLRALKDNAMVAIKAPTDEEWPREHKYDNLDFTYDVNENTSDDTVQVEKPVPKFKSGKEYKVFSEGEGPPSDPTYSFLADAVRDGVNGNKKDLNNRPKSSDSHKNPVNRGNRGGTQNSFNNKNRNSNYQRGGFQRSSHHGEYKDWKNERMNVDRDRDDKKREGNWRREDKDHKIDTGKTSPKLDIGNLTISISQSQEGEVKSVKLTSPPVIGTGRVGPRQISKPQFEFQTVAGNQHDSHNSTNRNHNRERENRSGNFNNRNTNNSNRNYNKPGGNEPFQRNNVNRKSDKRNNNVNTPGIIEPNKQPKKAISVQDRLQRNRGTDENNLSNIKRNMEYNENGSKSDNKIETIIPSDTKRSNVDKID